MTARLLLLSMLFAGPAFANDAFFKAEVVEARSASGAAPGPNDAAWQKVPAQRFRLTPQRSVRLNDRLANEVLTQPGSIELQVRAWATAKDVALLVEWPDAAREVVREDESNTYADSVAVETPVRFGPGLRLPAIGMGDDEMHVHVQLLRATKEGASKSDFSAAGFGSLTRQAPGATSNAMAYDTKANRWRAVLTVPLDADAQGLVPVAFAVWDGTRLERAGYKRLSSWHFVRLPQRKVDPSWVKALAFGYFPGDLGDAARGKPLVEGVCVGCHHLPGKAFAPAGIAPSLEGIGAIATASYLRDSIREPSQVALRGPNPNQHYLKLAPRDANGAHPNSPAYEWSFTGPDGKRASKMPSFTQFTAEQLADMLAFLKSLDGPPPEKT